MDWPAKTEDEKAKFDKETKQGLKKGMTKHVKAELENEYTRTLSMDVNERSENGTDSNADGKKKEQRQGETLAISKADYIIHNSMTLDQFYYVSLDNTADRDNDQVLGRYIMNRAEDRKNYFEEKIEEKQHGTEIRRDKIKEDDEPTSCGIDTGTSQNQSNRTLGCEKSETTPIGNKAKSGKIFTVNQLWLWFLDESKFVSYQGVSY
jgi:phage/plasmid-associated DNA primase